MNDLTKKASALLEFVENNGLGMQLEADKDLEFEILSKELKESIAKTESLLDIDTAKHLIRRCFATAIQTTRP